MTTRSNHNSSDRFDSDNTPNFLTKGIEVEQKIAPKADEDQPSQSRESSKNSDSSTKAETSSFGFFTSDSRVRSFSSNGPSKRSSSSRWNSGENGRSNSGGSSGSSGSNTSGGHGSSANQDGNSHSSSRRHTRNRSENRHEQPELESPDLMDTDDMERNALKYGERSRPTREMQEGRFGREEEDVNIDTSKIIDSSGLRKKSMEELVDIAKEYGIGNVSRLLKHNIISSILRAASSKGEIIQDIGVIELVADNYGFLRYSENNYVPSSDNIYVSQNQVKRFGLKTGDLVEGYAKEPRRSEKYFPMFKVIKINGRPVEESRNIMHFDNFTPIFPKEKLNLDLNIGPKDDVSTRVIDIIAPIGKGQRALIVAPPRSGKTVIMKNIANVINSNHPDVKLIVLLIDERPEEFTDMTKCVVGEVVSSTFDEPAERHVALAEIIISKAKRMVEQGQDVVILLDSITRLARAYNAIAPSSGKILTGGIDSNALQRPKRFFGAARNITGAGSLTIIATALVDTGSKMDEVIFEEFKGRGNSEIVLDRRLADKRVFPAIDVLRSGTRNEEEMVSGETLSKMWALRKIISGMNDQVKAGSSEAIDFLLKEIKKTSNNSEFFTRMNG